VVSFLLIQLRSVQVYAAQKVAVYLSGKLHTRVDIGSVDIEFLKKIVLEDVYVEDLHHDTLLYSKKLKLDIGNISLKKHKLYVYNLVLTNTKASLVKYKGDEDLNLQFILDAFATHDTIKQTTSTPWDISVREVTLLNTDFTYRNEHDTSNTTGVNYSDIHAKNINSRLKDIRLNHDTIYATVDYLSTKEKSGFEIKNLSSYAKISSIGMQFSDLIIKTNSSSISTDLSFKYKHYGDFQDFINQVSIKADINPSHVELDDIAYFAPALRGSYKNFVVSGKISGKVNDLSGKKMNILLSGTTTQFIGNIKLTGLPNIDETSIYLNVDQLKTNYFDLKQLSLPPFDTHQTLNVPANIAKLGNMKFKGTFTGLYNDFYAYGNFSSALGELSTDLAVHHDGKKNKESYEGKLQSTNFDFGTFFGAPLLGKATANITIDGAGLTLEQVTAKLNGTINSLEYNHYTYKNVTIQGNIAKQIFKGKLDVKDDNIDFDFNGKVDFTGKLPRLDFITTLNRADLGALNFINTTKKTILSTQLIIDVTGNNIDNLIGSANFDNTICQRDNETFKSSVFSLVSEENNGIKTIKILSDILDAKVNGTFKILELPVSVEKLLSNYLPSYFDSKMFSKTIQPQNFEYSFVFKKTDAATRLFAPKVTIAPNTSIKGSFNSVTNKLQLTGNSTKLTFGDFVAKNWNVNANDNNGLQFSTACERLYINDSSWLNGFNLTTTTQADSLILAMNWDNKSKTEYNGDLKALFHFNADKIIELKILPSQFTIADSVWSIAQNNQVIIDSTYITVNELKFEHSNQSISLNGTISDNKTDQLKLLLTDFNLVNLNSFVKSSGTVFKGIINGESTVSDIYHNPLFTSNTKFNSMFINNNEIGNGDIKSEWDNTKEALYLNGSFTLGIVPNISFSGYYYPKKMEDNIDLKLDMQALQLQLFEPFIKNYCPDFKGFFSGSIAMKGSLKNPKLSGTINVNAKKVTVGYLNTTYNFSGDITVENNSFGVQNLNLYDMNHNKAIVTGKVYHQNFKNFQLDFDIATKKFMCLNTTEANNSLYYGKAYVSGIVNISGFTDNILIEANVKTESVPSNTKSDKLNLLSKAEMTKLYIPLSSPGELSENNFITFVKKDSTIKLKNNYKVELGGLTLDFDLDVTPDAEVQLIFDQKVGDIIKSRGRGNIKMEINTKGDFKMFGDYVVESGDYLFTLKNIINKKFDLEKGGTIKWSGIPYKADLNLSAVYKARASIKPFFVTDSTSENAYKNRYPVDLRLLLTNDLLSPTINFDIALPTVDAGTRQQVLSYINNDAEMNRQVFSLLILNSFVTPYQLSNAGSGANVGSAAGSNTSELLSNQFSNMLSKISKDFDVGVNYRPGDDISKKELEVALSTQLFNDKLTIDGNVGVNSANNTATTTSQSTNNIVGDVNIDYKLTDDGKARLKAFNKANDYSQVYQMSPYTQGVGIFYREEFDTLGELYKRYLYTVKKNKNKDKQNGSTP
jgi:hypothetical protein